MAEPATRRSPTPWRRKRHAAGTSLNDTRACTACSCAAPSASCSGTFSFYSDAACSSELATLQAGSCESNTVGIALAYRYAAVACASKPQTAPTPAGEKHRS